VPPNPGTVQRKCELLAVYLCSNDSVSHVLSAAAKPNGIAIEDETHPLHHENIEAMADDFKQYDIFADTYIKFHHVVPIEAHPQSDTAMELNRCIRLRRKYGPEIESFFKGTRKETLTGGFIETLSCGFFGPIVMGPLHAFELCKLTPEDQETKEEFLTRLWNYLMLAVITVRVRPALRSPPLFHFSIFEYIHVYDIITAKPFAL
jgi:hypothetical protein